MNLIDTHFEMENPIKLCMQKRTVERIVLEIGVFIVLEFLFLLVTKILNFMEYVG